MSASLRAPRQPTARACLAFGWSSERQNQSTVATRGPVGALALALAWGARAATWRGNGPPVAETAGGTDGTPRAWFARGSRRAPPGPAPDPQKCPPLPGRPPPKSAAEKTSKDSGCGRGTVPLMTATTLAADTTPTTAAGPNPALSWLETAVAILNASPDPLTASGIVAVAQATGRMRSTTRTPAQSVNRDLHRAARAGDTRFVTGPLAGQFCGNAAATARPCRHSRLPIQPLASLIAARGGLGACGVRQNAGDSPERVRWVARLERAFLRSRRRGWIGFLTADDLAIALSLHPYEVFGDRWWCTC